VAYDVRGGRQFFFILVAETQPLVGGVKRVAPPFGGSPPDDGPATTPIGSGQLGETGQGGCGTEGPSGGGRSNGRVGGGSSGVGGGGGASAPGPGNVTLGKPHGADKPDGGLAEEAGGSAVDDADNGGMDDGASASSDGSGGTVPGPQAANPRHNPRMQVAPVSATTLYRGGERGRSRRAAVAGAAVETALPGGGELMWRLAESLSDGARRFDEKKKTRRVAKMELERTKRMAMLTAAVGKHPENETFRDLLKIAMGEPAGSSDPTLWMNSFLYLYTFTLKTPVPLIKSHTLTKICCHRASPPATGAKADSGEGSGTG